MRHRRYKLQRKQFEYDYRRFGLLYSIGGDININGANIDIGGILYAQTGSVRINCSRINVNGRIIGNALSVNTSSLTINASDDDLDALPQSGGGVMLVK